MAHDFSMVVINPLTMFFSEEPKHVKNVKLGMNVPEAVKRYMYEILGEEKSYGFQSTTELKTCFIGGKKEARVLLQKMKDNPIKLDGIEKDTEAYMKGMDCIINNIQSGNLDGISIGSGKVKDKNKAEKAAREGDLPDEADEIELKQITEVDNPAEAIATTLYAFRESQKLYPETIKKWYLNDEKVESVYGDFIRGLSSCINNIGESDHLAIIIH